MARDYKRLSRRAKHLIARLRRTKHAAVQNVIVHELEGEIHRRRFGRAPKTAMPNLGAAGHWRPLSRRSRSLLSQLRRTKVWSVQRRLVKELAEEIKHGRVQVILAARKAWRRAARRGRRIRQAVARTARNEREIARSLWERVRPSRSRPASRERPQRAPQAVRARTVAASRPHPARAPRTRTRTRTRLARTR